jgi:alanine dehydrogenase
MKIGVVKEIKDRENRVALMPQGAEELVKRGHSLMVEAGAGIGSGFDDEAYRRTAQCWCRLPTPGAPTS